MQAPVSTPFGSPTGQLYQLPGGAPLSSGEVPLVSDRFMLSTIAAHLHTEITLTNRRLHASRPNTLWGLIPTGHTDSDFPIENIAGIRAWTRISFLGIVVGLFCVLLGMTFLSTRNSAPLFGPIILLLGVLLLLLSPRQAIEIMNSGGGRIRFPVSAFERGRSAEFANNLSQALAQTGAQRLAAAPAPASASLPWLAPGTAPGAPAMASQADVAPARVGSTPAEALTQLAQLRNQGLIDDSEYAAKRAEILARL